MPFYGDKLLAGQKVLDSTGDHDSEQNGLFNGNGFDGPAGQEWRQFFYDIFQVRQLRHKALVTIARRHSFIEPFRI